VALLISSVSNIAQALSCLGRIQDFLLFKKRNDYRITRQPSHLNFRQDDSTSSEAVKSDTALFTLKNASFGWDENKDRAALRDVSVEVHRSTLTFVVGPVASGKSTILKSLLGEAYLHGGTIDVTCVGNIAYCDQDAWILNQTIRENIVAFSGYTEGFYKTVIKACQLDEDLSHLPQGDLSKVGSQGISLSGGQKQRIVSSHAVIVAETD
jgi:ATP-binding cassette, subfamily C (CFTR/MRP), member 1